MGIMSGHSKPQLFNTPLEAGVRALVILEAFAPAAFDIATLSLLDYYVVHTGDAGGPPSIHPEIKARTGEYFIRRHLVEQGVALMMRAFLVDRVTNEFGIAFRSHETAAAMIDLLGSDYNKKLLHASEWLADQARKIGHTEFLRSLKDGIDRWSHEIVGEAGR